MKNSVDDEFLDKSKYEYKEGNRMNANLSTKLYGWIYMSSFVSGMKLNNCSIASKKQLKKEYNAVIEKAKDIGKSRMMSAYCMGAFFIALYHLNKDAKQNYIIFHDGLKSNKLFKKALGTADSYLSDRKMSKRKEWEKESHFKRYENEWVVDVLFDGRDFKLGYDYHECGICKLCSDEGCFEIAKYLCELDYLLADMMGMKLKRTQTLADGGEYCDFRYSKK